VTGPIIPAGQRALTSALSRLDHASSAVSAASGGQDGSFANALAGALGDVSGLQNNAQDAIAAFVRGDNVELHQVMAASEEASLSLEILVEVRNKLAEAYRSVMNMQA
jgi:flagellar hook-basal body complex protein FliE